MTDRLATSVNHAALAAFAQKLATRTPIGKGGGVSKAAGFNYKPKGGKDPGFNYNPPKGSDPGFNYKPKPPKGFKPV